MLELLYKWREFSKYAKNYCRNVENNTLVARDIQNKQEYKHFFTNFLSRYYSKWMLQKKKKEDMMVHINGVETAGIQDNNRERPAFIHGQTQDAKRIILRFAETSRRDGESYLQKKKNVTSLIKFQISGMSRVLTDCTLRVLIIIMQTFRAVNTYELLSDVFTPL